MRIPFRQGIVRCQTDLIGNPNYLSKTTLSGEYIDLVVSPNPTVITFAHMDVDYVFEEKEYVTQAWGPFTVIGQTQYLYWDINPLTAALTRSFTIVPPTFGRIAPNTPIPDQHWFDLNTNRMRVWNGSKWVEKIRVFAGTYDQGANIIFEPIGSSEVGLNNIQSNAGYIMYNQNHRGIRKSDGRFLTSQTEMFIHLPSSTSPIKIEDELYFVSATEYIPMFSAIEMSGPGTIKLGSNVHDVHGIVLEDLQPGDITRLVVEGPVYNEQWNWPLSQIGAKVYCGTNGEIQTTIPGGNIQILGYILDPQNVYIRIGATSVDSGSMNTGITSVNALTPLSVTAGVNPIVSIVQASTTNDGFMSAADKIELVTLSTGLTTLANEIMALQNQNHYDLQGFYSGPPTAGMIIYSHVASRNLTMLHIDATQVENSNASSNSSISIGGVTNVFRVYKNSILAGYFTFSPGVHLANATIPGDFGLIPGDILTITAPPNLDSAIADISVTVKGMLGLFTGAPTAVTDPGDQQIPDTTPDTFNFTPVTGSTPDAVVTTPIITISGINTATPVTVTGGSYSINGGPFTSAPGTILNGQTLQLQVSASAQLGSIVNVSYAVGTLSGTFSVTTRSPITVPNAFSFTDASGINLNTQTTSNTVTLTGFDVAVPISITGGEYSLNGGLFTSTDGQTSPGDTLALRTMSSGSFSTGVSATVTVGSGTTVSSTWNVTTRAAVLVPSAFAFTNQTDVAVSSPVTSNTVTLTGFDIPATITITGGTYSVNGGAYVTSAGSVSPGDTLSLQVTSSSGNLTTSIVTVIVAGVATNWYVTTVAVVSTMPNPFAFTDVSNATVNTQTTSNTITLSGYSASTTISISGGEYSVDGGNTFSSAAGSIAPNSSLTLRTMSSVNNSTGVPVMVTVGGVSSTWTVMTVAAPITVPNAFSFTDVSGAALSTLTASNTITLSGFNAPTTISVTGGTYSLNGGAFVPTAGTMNPGDTLALRVTSSASYSTNVSATVTVGGVSSTWNVATAAQVLVTTPNPFTFTDVTGATDGSSVASNTLTLTGFNTGTPITITGGSYSINGGTYTSAAGTLQPGQSLTLQVTAAATDSTAVSATVIVGGVSSTWSVITATVVISDAPYYGIGTSTGWGVTTTMAQAAANILALPNRLNDGTRTGTFVFDTGPNQWMYFAYPESFGQAIFLDTNSQFTGGWDGASQSGNGAQGPAFGPIIVPITISGNVVNYYLYRTDYDNLGSNNFQVL